MFVLVSNIIQIVEYINLTFFFLILDVRPAKKDNQSGNAGNSNAKQMGGPNSQFNSMNKQFKNTNEHFNANKPNFTGGNASFNINQNFGNDNTFGNNQKELNPENRSGESNLFDDGNQARDSDKDQFNGKHSNNSGNDHFNNLAQNRGNNQFNLGNPNRGLDQFGNQNRGTNNQFGNNQMGNQNRLGGNQNRNQNNQGNNQNVGPGAGGTFKPRGTRGGKNKNKNNHNNANTNSFRDRSPINRGNRIDDKTTRDWDHKQGDRRGSNFGRDSFNDNGNRYDDFKTTGTRDTNASFG